MKVDFGIEEELMIVDNENNLIKKSAEVINRINASFFAYPIIELNAKKHLWKINQEPCSEQIEYSTQPKPLHCIREAMNFGRKLLGDATRLQGLVEYNIPFGLFFSSKHPQSNPNPMCGVHVHVSVPKMDYVLTRRIYNKLWNYLPELIGLTKVTDRLNRSNVLNFAPFFEKLYTVPVDKLRETETIYGKKLSLLINMPKQVQVLTNNRMTDIAVRGKYYYNEFAQKFNKIEIRIFDVHKNLDFVNGYLEIIEGLVLESIDDEQLGRNDRMKYYMAALEYPKKQNRYLNRNINNLIRRFCSEPNEILRLRDEIKKAQEMGTSQTIRPDDTRGRNIIFGGFRALYTQNTSVNMAGSSRNTYSWDDENLSPDESIRI